MYEICNSTLTGMNDITAFYGRLIFDAPNWLAQLVTHIPFKDESARRIRYNGFTPISRAVCA